MTPKQKTAIQHASKVLAILQQQVAEVLKIAPKLAEVNNLSELELSDEQTKVVKDRLIDIALYKSDVDKAMASLSVPLLSVKNKPVFDWYQNDATKKLIRKLVRGGYAALFISDWDTFDLGSENSAGNKSHKNHIWDAVNITIHCANMYLHALEDDVDCDGRSLADKWREDNGVDIDLCMKLINQPYFNPDAWAANAMSINPTVVTRSLERIPTHVKQRVHEIYHSFIFGNPMAAIALSRCLLEFVILDRKLGGDELYNADGKVKRLSALAGIAAQGFPELENDMKFIIESGNEIMHPRKKNVTQFLHPGSALQNAKQCVEKIMRIVGALYSQQ